MKKYLLLILLFVGINHTFAQRMIETGNNWNMVNYSFLSFNNFKYNIGSDTIYNGIAYKQLIINDSIPANGTGGPRFVRETEDGKVFSTDNLLPWSGVPEMIIYDFGLMPLDTFTVGAPHEPSFGGVWVVSTVDTIILSDGISRRRLFLEDVNSPSSTTIWVEGIGDIVDGPFHAERHYWTDFGQQLLCANQEGNLIYQNPSYESCFLNPTSVQELDPTSPIKIYPNPVQDLFNIEFSTTDYSFTEIHIFNTLGTSVYHQTNTSEVKEIDSSQWTPGMYDIILKEKSGKSFSKKIIKQ